MRKFLKSIPEIKVGAGFILLIAFVLCIDSENMFLFAGISALIHEASHLAAIYICGGRAERIHLTLYGAYIELSKYPMIPYKKEFLIAVAGPAASAVAAYAFSSLGQYFQNNTLFIFAGINLMLALLNLLPAYPLDGGRMLRCFLLIILDEDIADVICRVFGAASAVAVIVFCTLFNFMVGFQLSMTVFCVFVAFSVAKSIVCN